jgi:hypothetical protein
MNSKYGGLDIRRLTALHGLPHCPAAYKHTLLKKKIKFSSYIRRFRQTGAVAKSYMRKGFLIYEEMRKYLVIFEEAVSHIYCSRLNFLIYKEN